MDKRDEATLRVDDEVECPRCANRHDLFQCPGVKAIDFNEDGFSIKRVEFLTPVDFPLEQHIGGDGFLPRGARSKLS